MTDQKPDTVKTWRDVAPGWYIKAHDFVNRPIEGDKYERSAFTVLMDDVTGVTENQMRVRAGIAVVEIVKQDPPKKDWVDKFEDFLDEKLSFLIHQKP